MENEEKKFENVEKTKSKKNMGFLIVILIGIIIVLISVLSTVLIMDSNTKTSNIEKNDEKFTTKDKNGKQVTIQELPDADRKKENGNIPNKSNLNKEDVSKDNIEVEKVGLTKAGDLVVKVTNNNEDSVCISQIKANFKDENNNFVYSDNAYTSYVVIPGKTTILTYFWGYGEEYDKYPNVVFQTELANSLDSFVYSGIELKANNTGDQIAVTVKNNSGEQISSVQVVVIYYQDDIVVGAERGSTSSSAADGEETYINVEYPKDNTYKDVSFDKYELYYINAHIK